MESSCKGSTWNSEGGGGGGEGEREGGIKPVSLIWIINGHLHTISCQCSVISVLLFESNSRIKFCCISPTNLYFWQIKKKKIMISHINVSFLLFVFLLIWSSNKVSSGVTNVWQGQTKS